MATGRCVRVMTVSLLPLLARMRRASSMSRGSNAQGPSAEEGHAHPRIPGGFTKPPRWRTGYDLRRRSVKSHTVRKPKPRSRTPRGLDRGAILEAAFALLDEAGEDGFSVRKVGAAMGIDPMTVLHHFRSKEELLRQIADRALGSIELPGPTGDWQLDLKNVASAYRQLAHRHPRLFHLHFRFHATGLADHVSSEIVYRALLDAGLPPDRAAGLGLSFYAFVLGFALAEIEGLLKPLEGEEDAELSALAAEAFPATTRLLPAFRSLDSGRAFDDAVGAFIAGIAADRAARKGRAA
jgi:AcrR family transcriptional regulator